MLDRISSKTEKLYSETDLRKVAEEFSNIRVAVVKSGRVNEFIDLPRIVESYEGAFSPEEETYNTRFLMQAFSNEETASLLHSGKVVDFLILSQTEDTDFGFALEEEEIAFLRSYKERQEQSKNYESLDAIGIEDKRLRIHIKAEIVEELDRLITEGKEDSLAFELLDDENVTPELLTKALESWELEYGTDAISESDMANIRAFINSASTENAQSGELIEPEDFIDKPPTIYLQALGPILETEQEEFNKTRSIYLDAMISKQRDLNKRDRYIKARNTLFVELHSLYQQQPELSNSIAFDEIEEAFFSDEVKAVKACRGAEADVELTLKKPDLLEMPTTETEERSDDGNEGQITSDTEASDTNVEVFAEAEKITFGPPPLDNLEGLDEAIREKHKHDGKLDIREKYNRAREAYFTAYVAHHQSAKSVARSKQLEILRKQYHESIRPIAEIIRESNVATDAQGKELMVAEFLDETLKLYELRSQAISKRDGVEKPNKFKEALSRTGRLALLGIFGLAAQQAEMNNSVEEPMTDAHKISTDSSAGTQSISVAETVIQDEAFFQPQAETEIESLSSEASFEPVLASNQGSIKMFEAMLDQMEIKDPTLYDSFVGSEETSSQAAERLAQETGLWLLSQIENRSALLLDGDALTMEDGELVFKRAGDNYQLTKGHSGVKQSWVTYL